MKKLLLVILVMIICCKLYSQKKDLKPVLYKLEDRIIKGDFEALKDIAKFLDDTTFVQEFLGYHNYPNSARGIAIRIIEENCLFTKSELDIDSSISTIKFLNLLTDNKISFDDRTGVFLITDLNKRTTAYQLKVLSEYDLKRLDTTVIKPPYPEWYYESQIDGFLITKNSEVLLQIASAWYKKRSRFNRYYFGDEEFLDLMKILTNIDLGVPDEDGKTTFLYQDDYYAKARLNYLIYWANHYNHYKWNEVKGYFENTKESANKKTKEEILFSLLNSEDDSVAIDAFGQLGEQDPFRVASLAADYEKGIAKNNFALPTFPFRFLKQMTLLTEYCRDKGIKYKADNWLLDSLIKLRKELSFYERHKLENNIINRLNLDEVTAVEYYGLIHGGNWDLTYSTGRILDKFYSKKWNELTDNKKSIEAYLKKSALFDRLGIIGNCNKYLRKFENGSSSVIDAIKQMSKTMTDNDIKQQAEEVMAKYQLPIVKELKPFKSWEGSNSKYGANDLTGRYLKIKRSIKKEDEVKNAIQELIGEISYSQLGEAIGLLQTDTSMDAFDRFHFLESDFGFGIRIYNSKEIQEFLNVYLSKSEYQVYEYYLKQTGMDCFTNSDSLNYSGVYENLKYNVVDAFVGGGGGRKDEGVYLIIKLLELKYKTSLGFPKKLCSWQGMYSCDCEDRAKAWMRFLEERKLVTPDKLEPPSISNND